MILSFRTDMPGQTGQIQIRLLGAVWSLSTLFASSSLIRVYTVCHSVCIVWTHYAMIEPHSSNFRVITIILFWGGVSEYLGNWRYNDEFGQAMIITITVCLLYHCSLYKPHRDKTNKMACAPSEDSDQPGHPPSQIRVFAVRTMGS